MPKADKRVLLGRGKGYLSAAGSQYRFIVFLLVVLGIYTFLLKVFQKLAEIVQLPVFLPVTLLVLLIFLGIVGTIYSHSFIGPMLRIRRSIDALADGDLNVSLRLRESDEPLLKELAQTITRLSERNRNAQALMREAAAELVRELDEFEERIRRGADAAELPERIAGLRKKQDLLEKAIRAQGKA